MLWKYNIMKYIHQFNFLTDTSSKGNSKLHLISDLII